MKTQFKGYNSGGMTTRGKRILQTKERESKKEGKREGKDLQVFTEHLKICQLDRGKSWEGTISGKQ